MTFWKKLKKPIFALAPMAGVTDPTFRQILASYSKNKEKSVEFVMWTEFISADGLFRKGKGAAGENEVGDGYDGLIGDLDFTEIEKPIVAQFFSKDKTVMKRAVILAEKLGYDGVDINMGCPDKNVCKQGAGASMIKTPRVAQEIILACKNATGLPVSVKTRIGYEEDELDNWLSALLEVKPDAITIHARTKKAMSKEKADWNAIKRAVDIRNKSGEEILIIGNGDVESISDGLAKVKETGCDGVMIGRGVFGNPWFFSGEGRPGLAGRLKVLKEHIKLFDRIAGKRRSFHNSMKKHFKSYIKEKGKESGVDIREIMNAKTADNAIFVIDKWLQSL